MHQIKSKRFLKDENEEPLLEFILDTNKEIINDEIKEESEEKEITNDQSTLFKLDFYKQMKEMQRILNLMNQQNRNKPIYIDSDDDEASREYIDLRDE